MKSFAHAPLERLPAKVSEPVEIIRVVAELVAVEFFPVEILVIFNKLDLDALAESRLRPVDLSGPVFRHDDRTSTPCSAKRERKAAGDIGQAARLRERHHLARYEQVLS